MSVEEVRRLIRHAAALAEIQQDLMRMVADHMGDDTTAPAVDAPTEQPGEPRRTRRLP